LKNKTDFILKDLNDFCKNSLIDYLDIRFTKTKDGYLEAKMPVDRRTIQPMGLLHGGAIMALAETVGSAGSYLMLERDKFNVVGIEINGNHIGNTKTDYVIAVGELIHRGQKTHVWDIKVFDAENVPISVCRLTNLIINKGEKIK